MIKSTAEVSAYTLISEIRKRPAAFIGGNTIERLDAFICGWCHREDDQKYDQFWLGFSEWVRRKYDLRSSHGFASILKFQFSDDRLALEKFFELFDEYMEKCSNT